MSDPKHIDMPEHTAIHTAISEGQGCCGLAQASAADGAWCSNSEAGDVHYGTYAPDGDVTYTGSND